MDEKTLEEVKKLTKNYYRVIRSTAYSDGECRIMLYDLTYKLMKLVNPEINIPKEELRPG